MAARERSEPRHARVLRVGVRGGDVRGPGVVAEPGPAVPARRHDHPPGPSPRGPRRAGLALGARQSRLRLSRDPDQRRRALRDPRARPRAPPHRELLHALGREHEHGRRARRQASRARPRPPLHDHRRRRARGRPPQPRALLARGARVLHPRRPARLGARPRERARDRAARSAAAAPARSTKRSSSNGPPRTCGSGSRAPTAGTRSPRTSR